MAEFQKATERFFFTGISCFPPDALPQGKFPYVRNIRTYSEGEMRAREGFVLTQTVTGEVHSLGRLNDPTAYNGGVGAVRLIGAGTDLYVGEPSDATPPALDSGYSGEPLTFVNGLPPQATRPFIYAADSDRYRKFLTDSGPYVVGIAQPGPIADEPDVRMQAQKRMPYDIQTSTAWDAAGTAASAPTLGTRVDTTISTILYDDGNTGYCSIVPASTDNITVGTLLTIGDPMGSFDNEIVTEVTIAVAATTVAAIIYDSGTTGLCTVMPAGSLGVGQLEAPPIEAYRRRAFRTQGRAYAVPRGEGGVVPVSIDPNTPTRRIRQVDFPVNCVIQLGAEIVRIESVAVGPDGRQSFRCRTSGTISSGDAISGLAAFRLYLPNTRVSGDGILRQTVENVLTFPEPATDEKARMTAGIQGAFAINLAQFQDGAAVLPQDELHLAVNISNLLYVKSIRVYIDVDATTNDFLQNYYFHEWRASDIISSIQATNAANVAPLVDSRKTVVTNTQLDATMIPVITREALQRTINDGQNVWQQPARFQRRYASMMASATANSAISQQMALGNNQWIDLRVKIGTLVRVGTDPTRTLADAKAFEILVSCEGTVENITPEPLIVKYSDLQIYGGGGPDVGETGDPYVYLYRYRSSLTGAVSNPSPASRGGIIPRRQNVDLYAVPSTDPQVDKIDWFRMGGALSRYTYVGTGPNTADAFTDDRMDTMIDGGEIVSYDNFQPWPLADIPRVGTCNVAGTAIERVSGDLFNTAWAPGSVILVNGRATTLYASPTTTGLLHVVDCVGEGTAVQFSLPGPTIMAQPLRSVWGDYQGFTFACGDAVNPGVLYWTNPNNVEAMSDANALVVTSGSEPLMGGGIYNTFPFVASSDDFYAIIIQPGADIPVRAVRTPCGRGFWTPWTFAVGNEGVYFLAADGIALTAGGGVADILTTPDLRAIFPTDGQAGRTVNGIPAVDMSQTTKLRLSLIAGWLYFDYQDVDGAAQTLLYDTIGKKWYHDNSDLTAFRVRLEEPGQGVYDQIVGGANGMVLRYDKDSLTDNGTAIGWDVYTRWSDAGMPRTVKQFGDLALNANINGGAGVSVTVVTKDGTVVGAPATYGAGGVARVTYPVALPDGDLLANNIGIRVSGTVTTARQSLFWWEPSFLVKADDIVTRAADWDDLGYMGAKFVQGVIIRANTYGAAKSVLVQRANDDGEETMITLSVNHDGEAQIAYPLAAAGWTPFVGELLRLKGADDGVPWQLLSYRFVWEPAPELATQWETQFTSNEWPGYGHCRDMVIAYEATAPLTLVLTYDDRDQVYTLPETGGLYRREYLVLCPGKGKAVRYRWTTPEPGRLYKRDISVRAQGWGLPTGYQVLHPFGGPSRSDGAAI